MDRPRLLLCGFGDFPGVEANPSAAVIRRLRLRGWAPPGADADYAVLPTVWAEAAGALGAARAACGAQGVLLTGVAGGGEGFRMEVRARNIASPTSLDAQGACNGAACVSATGPGELFATAPIQAVVEAIRAEGLPAEPSWDCGDYLCNHTLYRLLEAQGEEPTLRLAGFLHLPPVEVLRLADLERGVQAAAAVMAQALAFGDARPLDA